VKHEVWPQWKADLSLLFVTVIWGATFTVVKSAMEDITPFYFLAARFTLASLTLALLPGTIDGLRQNWRLTVLPGLMLTAGFALQTTGLLYTSASRAGFITGLSVVLVPLIVSIRHRAWPPVQVMGGVLLATLGLYFLSGAGQDGLNIGDFLVFGCAISFALQIITIGKRAKSINPLSFALGMTALAALNFWLLAIGLERPPAAITLPVIFAVGMTGLLATALAFYLQCRMQQFTSATHTALIFSAEPVFAAVFGYLLAGERLGLVGILGGALIVTGIIVAELRSPTPLPPS